MRLHLNSEIQIPSLKIKKMHIGRMDEEYKNICHFTFKDVYYVIPPQYEVYYVNIELEDTPPEEDYLLLYVLEFGKYKGSYKTVIKKDVTAQFPDTWHKEYIARWCEDETQKVLDLCQIIP